MGNIKNFAFWAVLFLLVFALFNLMNSGSPLGGNSTEITYSEFIRQAESGNVQYVTVDGEKLIVSGADGKSYYTINPRDDQMTDRTDCKCQFKTHNLFLEKSNVYCYSSQDSSCRS